MVESSKINRVEVSGSCEIGEFQFGSGGRNGGGGVGDSLSLSVTQDLGLHNFGFNQVQKKGDNI
jgi:hypothetical protein